MLLASVASTKVQRHTSNRSQILLTNLSAQGVANQITLAKNSVQPRLLLVESATNADIFKQCAEAQSQSKQLPMIKTLMIQLMMN